VIPSEVSNRSWKLICDLYQLPDVTRIVALNGDQNRVYRITIPGSADRVLRVSHPDTGTHPSILSECLVLEHVRHHTDLNVPSPIRDRHGRFVTTICEHDGAGSWQASMFSYIDGEVLREEQLTPDTMLLIGMTLGRLDLALKEADKAIRPKPSKTRACRNGNEIVKWAISSFSCDPADVTVLNACSAGESLQSTLSEIGNRLRNGCRTSRRSLPHQLLHLDAHLDNLLYDGTTLGILDFGSMAYGPRIYELAAPLCTLYESDGSKRMINSPDGAAKLIDALLAGYGNCIPLSQTELKAFPLFQALRLFAALSWAVGRQDMPDWKAWLQVNGAAAVRHIVALLDTYECNAGNKRFFLSKIWQAKRR